MSLYKPQKSLAKTKAETGFGFKQAHAPDHEYHGGAL